MFSTGPQDLLQAFAFHLKMGGPVAPVLRLLERTEPIIVPGQTLPTDPEALRAHLEGVLAGGRPPASTVSSVGPQPLDVARVLGRIQAQELEEDQVASGPDVDALSITTVMEHPERFRDRPLEVVLFDLDGTITTGQSWVGWVLDAARYGPREATGKFIGTSVGRIASGSARFLAQELRPGSHLDKSAVHEFIREAVGDFNYKNIVAGFRRYYLSHGRRGLSPFVLKEIERHRKMGRLVLVASASPQDLVRLFAPDLHLPPENIIGSVFELDDRGFTTGDFEHLHGGTKMTRMEREWFGKLREAGIILDFVQAYSDSDSDLLVRDDSDPDLFVRANPNSNSNLPMLEYAMRSGGTSVAVNSGKPELKAAVIEAGGFAVHETGIWPGRGTVSRLLYSGDGGAGRKITDVSHHPMSRPPLLGDLFEYGLVALASGASLAVAAPLAEGVRQAIIGNVDWSDILERAPELAAAAALWGAAGAAIGHFLTPKSGVVPTGRRWFMERGLPLAGATGVLGATLANVGLAVVGNTLGRALGETIVPKEDTGSRFAGLRRLVGRTLLPLAGGTAGFGLTWLTGLVNSSTLTAVMTVLTAAGIVTATDKIVELTSRAVGEHPPGRVRRFVRRIASDGAGLILSRAIGGLVRGVAKIFAG